VDKAQSGGLDLMRERGRPDFDAREVTLLHRIIPHLSSGLKAAARASTYLLRLKGEASQE